MKKICVATLCVLASLFFSLNVPADTVDKNYSKSYITAGTWESTAGYYKENSSKVYIKPSHSPTGKTRVRVYCYVGGSASNETAGGTVTVSDGNKYAITNYVVEHGDYTSGKGYRCWLRMTPTSGSGSLSGVWSPDWSGSGNVTIV